MKVRKQVIRKPARKHRKTISNKKLDIGGKRQEIGQKWGGR